MCHVQTVLTDYPDRELLENLETNVDANLPGHLRDRVLVEGYIWGTDASSLLKIIREGEGGEEEEPGSKYDLIILSDLIFNHSQVTK